MSVRRAIATVTIVGCVAWPAQEAYAQSLATTCAKFLWEQVESRCFWTRRAA